MEFDARNEVLLGAIAAQAAIYGQQREVFRLWLDRDRDDTASRRLTKLCRDRGIRYTPVGRDALDQASAKAGHDENHGGVLAEVGKRKFVPSAELVASSNDDPAANPSQNPPRFIAMLDGVEDPFNFGQAVRALYAAGCTGLLVRKRNWTQGGAGAVVARASAGATERIAMAIVEGPEEAAELATAHGVMVVATGQRSAEDEQPVPYTKVDFTGPTLLMIGGERRGLRRSFLADCENVVTVPYAHDVIFPAALGTVAATAVLAFEITRQRAEAAAG